MKKTWFLTSITIALFLLGFYPLNLFWCSWLAWLPFFLLFIKFKEQSRHLLLHSFLIGILYYSITLSWILNYQISLYFLALLLISPIFVIYFFLLRFIIKNISNPILKISSVFFLWVALQKLYSLTPIGTTLFEVPFYAPTEFYQSASLLGLVFLPAVIIATNASIAYFIKTKNFQYLIGFLFFILLLSVTTLWGAYKPQENDGKNIKLSLIQHNLPISGKWKLENSDLIYSTYRRYALKASKNNPDIIIFPLYSLPEDALRKPAFFSALAKETKTHILFATHVPEDPKDESLNFNYINVAILISPQGHIIGTYQATQGVPFASAQETTAKEYKILKTAFGKLGILLCYEDINPRIVKESIQKGAELLIALSNPGHFIKTPLPYYHLMQDRLRAIESNRQIVRVSANGYSGLIDRNGSFSNKSDLDKEQTLQVTAKTNQTITPYQKYPDWLSIISFLFLAVLLLRNYLFRSRK